MVAKLVIVRGDVPAPYRIQFSYSYEGQLDVGLRSGLNSSPVRRRSHLDEWPTTNTTCCNNFFFFSFPFEGDIKDCRTPQVARDALSGSSSVVVGLSFLIGCWGLFFDSRFRVSLPAIEKNFSLKLRVQWIQHIPFLYKQFCYSKTDLANILCPGAQLMFITIFLVSLTTQRNWSGRNCCLLLNLRCKANSIWKLSVYRLLLEF